MEELPTVVAWNCGWDIKGMASVDLGKDQATRENRGRKWTNGERQEWEMM